MSLSHYTYHTLQLEVLYFNHLSGQKQFCRVVFQESQNHKNDCLVLSTTKV
jgi:hypothetical protein